MKSSSNNYSSIGSSSIPPFHRRHHSNNNSSKEGNLGSLRGSAFSAYSRPNQQTGDHHAHSYRDAVPAPKPMQAKSAKVENTTSVHTTMASLSNLDLTASAAWDKSPVSVARTTTTTTWSSHPNNHVGSVTLNNPAASAALSMPMLVTAPLFQPSGSPWTPMPPNTTAPSFGTTTSQLGSNHATTARDAMEASPIDSSLYGYSRTTFMSTEESFLTMKPWSPTENVTSDSSGCGSSVLDDDGANHEMDTTNVLARAAVPATTASTLRQLAPVTRRPPIGTTTTTTPIPARIVPHAFVSPSPEETSDPEEQARRKQARAREQQELILERVRAARQERKVHPCAKSSKQKFRRKHKSRKADKSGPSNDAQVNNQHQEGTLLACTFERGDKPEAKKKQRKSRRKKADTGGKLNTITAPNMSAND